MTVREAAAFDTGTDMTDDKLEPRDDLLRGWTAIAQFLNVPYDTAYRMRKELPIGRLAGVVTASKRKILAALDKATGNAAEPQPGSPRRRGRP